MKRALSLKSAGLAELHCCNTVAGAYETSHLLFFFLIFIQIFFFLGLFSVNLL